MTHHCDPLAVRRELDREHNVIAAALRALLPGMGHAYKGHYGEPLAILLLGVPLSLWVGVLLSLATLGLGMLIPVFFWATVALSAYYADDHRAHHPLNLL